jgi:hypothetical protein
MHDVANPGDPFSSWVPYVKNGTFASALSARVDTLITKIKPFFFNTTTFVNAELWEYAPETFDAAYRSVYPINVAGTHASGSVIGSQSILTLRTFGGGIMKVDLRGTSSVVGPRIAIPASGIIFDLAVYMADALCPWWARDNTYAAVALYWLPGLNEHAFKVLNR